MGHRKHHRPSNRYHRNSIGHRQTSKAELPSLSLSLSFFHVKTEMKIIVAGLQYSASQSVVHPAFGPIPHSPISRGPFFYRPTKNCPNSVLQQAFTGQTRGPAPASPFLYGTNIRRYQTELTWSLFSLSNLPRVIDNLHEIHQRFELHQDFLFSFPRSSSKGPTMAVSLSSSSTITPITLQPKLKPIHAIGTVNFGYSFNSHGVSLRRSAVVASAITGASGKA